MEIAMRTAIHALGVLAALSHTAQADTANFFNSVTADVTISMQGGTELQGSQSVNRTLTLPTFDSSLGVLIYQQINFYAHLEMDASLSREGCEVECNAPRGGASLYTADITAIAFWQTTCQTPSCSHSSNSLWNTYPEFISKVLPAGQEQTDIPVGLEFWASVSTGFEPNVNIFATFNLRGSLIVDGFYFYEAAGPGPSPIPLPASLWFLLTALGMFGLINKRIKSRG
jgi:hypothetical protein